VNTGRYAEAEAILRRWSGARSLQTGNLYAGALATARGDLVDALSRYQALMKFAGTIGIGASAAAAFGVVDTGTWGSRPTDPRVLMGWLESAMHAARLLCDLGRVGEARQVLQLAGAPQGEYTALLRVLAERYADFVSGSPPAMGHDELERLAAWASSLRGTWGLLALCAWEYARRGDAATAARLIAEERARPNASRLAMTMPSLWRWMQAPHPA
jgi:hypothetical protein